MSRTAFITAWVVATALATLLAFAAVSFVTGDLRPGPQVLGLAERPTETSTTTMPAPELGATTTVGVEAEDDDGPAPTSSEAPSTTVPSPAGTASTSVPTSTTDHVGTTTDAVVVTSIGGSAGISCAGSSVSLDWYTPKDGFLPEIEYAGPVEVELYFEAEDEWKSKIHADCHDGVVLADVEEHQEDD